MRCSRNEIAKASALCRRRQQMTPLKRAGWCFFVRCPQEGNIRQVGKPIDIAEKIAGAKLA
jgi:hypothetical protein